MTIWSGSGRSTAFLHRAGTLWLGSRSGGCAGNVQGGIQEHLEPDLSNRVQSKHFSGTTVRSMRFRAIPLDVQPTEAH